MQAWTIGAPTAEQPLAEQTTPLDGRDYRLTFDWIERAGYWIVSIDTVDGVPLLSGQPLVANWNLLRNLTHRMGPRGKLFVLTRDGRMPDLTELATRAEIVHVIQ